jgi:hypothetical protein
VLILNDKRTMRSVFCVLNNPSEHGFTGTPEEVSKSVLAVWSTSKPDGTRGGAVVYCISPTGLHHLHMVFECTRETKFKFATVKRLFPTAHIEMTMGNKTQAEDYINKTGKYAEKGETVLFKAQDWEIQGCQGRRKDLDEIADMIADGMTPQEILNEDIKYYTRENIIKKAYFNKRYNETPVVRDIDVHWLFGTTGTGKSYKWVELVQTFGEQNVYKVTDYEHPWDSYNGEPVLFLDEFRGGIHYNQLLMALDKYKCELPARYTNCKALWTSVYITSPLLPQEIYTYLDDNDKLKQLYRRITDISYYYFDTDKNRQHITLPGGFHSRSNFEYLSHQKQSAPVSVPAPTEAKLPDDLSEYVTILE